MRHRRRTITEYIADRHEEDKLTMRLVILWIVAIAMIGVTVSFAMAPGTPFKDEPWTIIAPIGGTLWAWLEVFWCWRKRREVRKRYES